MIFDYLKLVLKNLNRRRIRSLLTLIGIVIGIAAFTGLVGASKGVTQTILEQLRYFRSNWIIIIPGKLKLGFLSSITSIPLFEERDLQAVKNTIGINVVLPILEKKLVVSYKGENLFLNIWGVYPKEFRMIDKLGLEKGRYLTSSDKYSAILGNSVAYELFERKIEIGKNILINGKKFKVIGIRNKYGGFLSNLEDLVIILPLETLLEISGEKNRKFSLLVAEVKEGFKPDEVGEEIRKNLCKIRKSCGDEDFTVITPSFVEKTVKNVTSLLTVMLGGIAGISLLVGCIGIANTMYTNVLERTREIGILKAIGASSKDIFILFLLESGFLGLIGGIIGVLFGFCIGEGFLMIRELMITKAELVEKPLKTHVYISLPLIAKSLLLSFSLGIISGVLPAWKASKLDPVEALRYE